MHSGYPCEIVISYLWQYRMSIPAGHEGVTSYSNLCLQSQAVSVRCGQRPQHMRGLREAIVTRNLPQFGVTKGQNSLKITRT